MPPGRAEERGVAVAEDASVGSDQPVPPPSGVGAMPTTGLLSGRPPPTPRRCAAEGEDAPVGGDEPVAAGRVRRALDDRLWQRSPRSRRPRTRPAEGHDATAGVDDGVGAWRSAGGRLSAAAGARSIRPARRRDQQRASDEGAPPGPVRYGDRPRPPRFVPGISHQRREHNSDPADRALGLRAGGAVAVPSGAPCTDPPPTRAGRPRVLDGVPPSASVAVPPGHAAADGRRLHGGLRPVLAPRRLGTSRGGTGPGAAGPDRVGRPQASRSSARAPGPAGGAPPRDRNGSGRGAGIDDLAQLGGESESPAGRAPPTRRSGCP